MSDPPNSIPAAGYTLRIFTAQMRIVICKYRPFSRIGITVDAQMSTGIVLSDILASDAAATY